jgi:MraZ protein
MVGRAGGIGGFRRPLHRRVVKRSIRRAGTGRAGWIDRGQRSSFMRLFLDNHSAKVDRKGRVSFPAGFRTALERFETRNFYLRPHHMLDCIEGFTEPALEKIEARLAALDAYSEEHELLSLALLGDTTPLTYDAEGRFSLPAKLQAHAHIEEALVFVGLGETFHIWEPALFVARRAESLARLREQPLTLPRGGAA